GRGCSRESWSSTALRGGWRRRAAAPFTRSRSTGWARRRAWYLERRKTRRRTSSQGISARAGVSMPERVETRAPTRIDLAGGTIDLWPLYLLHDEPVTVNAAIDQYARALIETTSHAGIELVAADLDPRRRLP